MDICGGAAAPGLGFLVDHARDVVILRNRLFAPNDDAGPGAPGVTLAPHPQSPPISTDLRRACVFSSPDDRCRPARPALAGEIAGCLWPSQRCSPPGCRSGTWARPVVLTVYDRLPVTPRLPAAAATSAAATDRFMR